MVVLGMFGGFVVPPKTKVRQKKAGADYSGLKFCGLACAGGTRVLAAYCR
jgi:hypothetical protein